MTGKAVGVMVGIKDITECCICTEMLTDPRMLPCIHTFCLLCLEKTGSQSQKKPGDRMPCPLCRKEFVIPTEGFLGVQKNFFMERLKEMAKLSQPSDMTRYCDSCNTSESETNAIAPLAKMYCIECEENLCDDCINYHKRQKQLKTHQIVAFGNQRMTEKLIKRAASINCDKHTKQSIEMYCHDCRKAICMKCFAIDHKKHRCSDVEDVADKFRKQIQVDIEKVKTSYADGLKIRNQVDSEKTSIIKQVENAETEIIKRANELKDLVDKNMQSLLAQLVSRKAETLKILQIQRDEIDMHLRSLDSFKTYCSEVKNKGTPGDVCRAVDDLCSQSSELEQKHKTFIDHHMSSFSIAFEKTNLEGLLSDRNIIGTFEGTEGADAVKKIPIVPPFSMQFSSEQLGVPLSGLFITNVTVQLTRLEDKVYVMYKASNRIHVYNISEPFSILEEFNVKDIKSPCDVAACATSNCLYVIDLETRCILKILPNERHVTLWLSDVGEPFILSVSSDGRVIIPRDGQPSFIEIYNSDAVLIQRVRLPEDIQHLTKVIETPTGNFIIHQRCSDHGISKVTKNGDYVHRFTSGDEGEMLNDSCQLEIIRDNDDVAVVTFDCDNSRMIIFDSEFKKMHIMNSDFTTSEGDINITEQ